MANQKEDYFQIDFEKEMAKNNSQRIRRCFMNGKQCIFYASKTEDMELNCPSAKDPDGSKKPLSVFVIMPYRPNLNTFFEWSLKKYLTRLLAGPDKKEGGDVPDNSTHGIQIHRADQYHDTGYIMCERVCKNIQDADLIVVDLSIENANVAYELGMAIGLQKPILAFCNKNNSGRLADGKILGAFGMKHDTLTFPIVYYPSVDELSLEPHAKRSIGRVPLKPKKTDIKILPMIIDSNDSNIETDDIKVNFSDALRGAVSVAINDIVNSKTDNNELMNALKSIEGNTLNDMGIIEKDKGEIYLMKRGGSLAQFDDIVDKVDSAFICIIDLINENPYSYFWLGYCHSRGINSIPIYRKVDTRNTGNDTVEKAKDPDKGEKGNNEKNEKNNIAFDIRALWYFNYDPIEAQKLSEALKSVFEVLITNDIPRMQRNIFWDRVTSDPTIYIYTGAVHNKDLNREVVGDWDLRTVSELVRYLSSTDVSVIPELENPIYSPGSIQKKLKGRWNKNSIKSYIEIIKQELRGKNCIIIASADVNPLTEVVLAHAYNVSEACFKNPKEVDLSLVEKNRVVIALKGWKEGDAAEEAIPTFFSRPGKDEKLHEGNYRGFLLNNSENPIEKKYKSQDDVTIATNDEEREINKFSLLSHLVIMKNPFNKENESEGKDNIIVLLNGVSGPGTFGLAEVLTGGKSPSGGKAYGATKTADKSRDSEIILKKLNMKLAEFENRSRKFLVEAFIQVDIEPPIDEDKGSNIQKCNVPGAEKDSVSGAEKDSVSGAEKDNGPGAENDNEQSAEKVNTSGGTNGKASLKDVQEKFSDLRNVVKWDLYKDKKIISENPRGYSY